VLPSHTHANHNFNLSLLLTSFYCPWIKDPEDFSTVDIMTVTLFDRHLTVDCPSSCLTSIFLSVYLFSYFSLFDCLSNVPSVLHVTAPSVLAIKYSTADELETSCREAVVTISGTISEFLQNKENQQPSAWGIRYSASLPKRTLERSVCKVQLQMAAVKVS